MAETEKLMRKTTRAEKVVKPAVYETPVKSARKPAEPPKDPKMGRPTKYSFDLAVDICVRLANGESIVQITKDDHMPSQATIYVWLRERPDFQEMYTRAREDQIDTNVDEIIAIADEMPPEFTDKDGRTTLDSTWINWQKNRIDARKWSAIKLKPRKYGDRVGLEGVEGGAPIVTQETSSERMLEIIKNLEMSKRAG
jgi:hypothetical protein